MTSIEEKEAELELFQFIYDYLQNENHVYFTELLCQLAYQKPSIFKYYQCEHCIKASISKFPDCFYVGKLNDTVLLTSTTTVRKGYYSHYLNYAQIGSMVTEIFTLCTSLIAKLELYEYLIWSLKSSRIVLLDTIQSQIVGYSEHCKQHFSCKHSIVNALEDFSRIFQINPVNPTPTILNEDEIKWISTDCDLDCEEGSLGTIFNNDTLLHVIEKTYIELAAELQLYEILKRETASPNCIQLNELAKILMSSSKPSREYMSSCAKLKTVVSLLPDIFYISNKNRIHQRQSVNMPSEDWYNSDRLNVVHFDDLLLELKEKYLKEVATINLIEIAKTKLQQNRHVSLFDMVAIARKNGYCRKYFHDVATIKQALLAVSGIFHVSKQGNVLLLSNHWTEQSIREQHDTISNSVLHMVKRSCRAVLSEIHMYCFLVYEYCCNLGKCQSHSLETLFRTLSSNSPVCKQYFTSVQKLENAMKNYPSKFKIDPVLQVYNMLEENEDLSPRYSTASPSSTSSIYCSDGDTVLSNNDRVLVASSSNSFNHGKSSKTLQLPVEKYHSASHFNLISVPSNLNVPSDIIQYNNSNDSLSSHVVQHGLLAGEKYYSIPAPLTSGKHMVDVPSVAIPNNPPSAYCNDIYSNNLFPSTFDSVSWGTEKSVTDTGTMNSLFETEGFVLLQHSNTIVVTIVDVVYSNGVRVKNLFDIDGKIVNCIAIGEGSTEINWKASVVWIGAKPVHKNCFINSKADWINLKHLYEKKFATIGAFFLESVCSDSSVISRLDEVDLSFPKDSKNVVEVANVKDGVILVTQSFQDSGCVDFPLKSAAAIDSGETTVPPGRADVYTFDINEDQYPDVALDTSFSQLSYDKRICCSIL